MITLVDIHGTGIPDGVEYIGRAGKNGKPRRSPLSNPFRVEDHGLAALRLYRVHLATAMANSDPEIISEIARLEALASAGDLVLGCWCCSRPAVIEGLGHAEPKRPCHGDLVATVITHWGTRLDTYARARHDGDGLGPERWAAWVSRSWTSPAAAMGSAFGHAELREMALVSPEIAAGMQHWGSGRWKP